MAKTIQKQTPESLGSLGLVIADVDCVDAPWLGQPFLVEDLGSGDIYDISLTSSSGAPVANATVLASGLPATVNSASTRLSVNRNNLVSGVEYVDGFRQSGLRRWQNFLTSAAVTSAVASGTIAAGATTVNVTPSDGTKFASGDIIVFDGGSNSAAQYAEVYSVATDTLTLKYGLAFTSTSAAPIGIVRKGIGTAVTLTYAAPVGAATITVSSATGMYVGDVLGISTAATTDASELLLIRGISSTTITVESLAVSVSTTVTTGVAVAHAAADKVYKVPHPPKIRYLSTTAGKDVASATPAGNVKVRALIRE